MTGDAGDIDPIPTLDLPRQSAARRVRIRDVFRGKHGSAQLGLIVAAAAVAGGMTIGSGIASHHAKSGYDLAWLADGKRGQLVQVDPVLGRSNVRLQVAGRGAKLDLKQGDGQLVVIDRKTGKISSIDLSTLLVGGTRNASPGKSVKLLMQGDRLFVADLARGSVQAVDPATEANIGAPWHAGTSLVDAGIDGQQQVWTLDAHSRLRDLRWSGSPGALKQVSSRSLQGVGPGSVIVAHERGVTVVGAGGTIARVGTGHDSSLPNTSVRGPFTGPADSPDDLVPVADPGASRVVIVGASSAVVDNVAAYGCGRPGAPLVFDGKVYVPCADSHQVLVLDPQGHPSGNPIHTPAGGAPQLTVSDGRLIVSVPGAGSAIVVTGSGSTHSFPTIDPGVGVQNPTQSPPPPPPPPSYNPQTPEHQPDHNGDVPGHDPGSSGGPTATSSGAPSGAPTGGNGSGAPGGGGGSSGSPAPSGSGAPSGDVGQATADPKPDGTVLVNWSGPSTDGGYTITMPGDSAVLASAPPGATSAIVTVLESGTSTALVVHANNAHGETEWSATTDEFTVTSAPGAVTGLTYTAGAPTTVVTLTVAWTAAPGYGGKVSYSVTADTIYSTVVTKKTTAEVTVPCAADVCQGTLMVTPKSSYGAGTAAQLPYSVSTGAAPPPSAPPTTTAPTTSAPPPPPSTSAAPPPPSSSSAPPPPPAPPVSGEAMLSATKTVGNDNTGRPATVTLTFNAAADWQSWSGATCNVTDNGYDIGAVPCNATSDQLPVQEYYESGTHTYQVNGTAAGGSATSAPLDVSVVVLDTGCPQSENVRSLNGAHPAAQPQCNPCPPGEPHCEIPFAAGGSLPYAVLRVRAILAMGELW